MALDFRLAWFAVFRGIIIQATWLRLDVQGVSSPLFLSVFGDGI